MLTVLLTWRGVPVMGGSSTGEYPVGRTVPAGLRLGFAGPRLGVGGLLGGGGMALAAGEAAGCGPVGGGGKPARGGGGTVLPSAATSPDWRRSRLLDLARFLRLRVDPLSLDFERFLLWPDIFLCSQLLCLQ